MALSLHPMSIACMLLRSPVFQAIAWRFARVFMRTDRAVARNGTLATLGSANRAQTIARRVEGRVVAYRDFVGQSYESEYRQRPVLDKAGYIQRYSMLQLLGDDWKSMFAVFKSSGSSGSPQYWPQLKRGHRISKWGFRLHLEQCFQIHRQKSVAIVGLSLGSWMGGDYLSWVLKCIAMDAEYPFCVFAPGNHLEEIVEMISEVQNHVDQVILFICPAAIGHLHFLAQHRGVPLQLAKLRYIVLGAPFPESMRLSLANRAGVPLGQSFLLSLYGSADTGPLGVESTVSIAIRQLLALDPAFGRQMGIEEPTPHLFHYCAPDAYLENVNDELFVTRWQGIPLVRYNLHDSVQFLDWPTLRSSVLLGLGSRSPDPRLFRIVQESSNALPPILAMRGRADRCLILCGTNLAEGVLDAAIRCADLDPILTGAYEARIEYENDRQFLRLDLELKPGVSDAAAIDRRVYASLVGTLGRLQPEFFEDWRNMYQLWDDDPDRRILRLDYHCWPTLSRSLETQPKAPGIKGVSPPTPIVRNPTQG
jgi:phenylacetate-CoA ligase